jgi:hypothetical protein
MRVIKIYLGKKKLITHKTNKMGYGNKSVSGVHPILKHMNKLGGNPEIKYDPIAHDEKGMGRGGKLGTAKYKSEGMPHRDNMVTKDAATDHHKSMSTAQKINHQKKSDGMPKYGEKGKGMPKITKKNMGTYTTMTDSKGVKVNILNKKR